MKGSKEILVDARGHRCPVPTLRLRRALERAPTGACLRLIADDPLARIDIPHFAAEIGLEILALTERGETIEALVRKRRPKDARRAVGGNDAPPG